MKFIKEYGVLIKNRLVSIKDRILKNDLIKRILNSYPLLLFLRFRAFMSSSLLGFSAFVLCNWAFLATARWAYMRYFDRWDFVNTYYYLTSSSLFFILIIIFAKYLATKNIFKRVWENKVKRDEFERLVIESNSLNKNSWVKQYGLFLVIPILIINITTGSELFLAIYLCTLSAYLINSFYISYCVLKTKIPQHLLPEPSKFYRKVYNRFWWRAVHYRRYGTRVPTPETIAIIRNVIREVNAEEALSLRVIALGVASLAGSILGADQLWAASRGRTPVLFRVFDLGEHRCYATDPKVRRRSFQLAKWGIDPSAFCYNGLRELDPLKVNEVYEIENERRYKTPARRQLEEEVNNLKNDRLGDQLRFEEELGKLKEEVRQLRELSIIANKSDDAHLSEKAKNALRDLEVENLIKRSESAAQKPTVSEKEGLPYMD